VKKIPVKLLRLVRQPIRVLTSRELGQVAGGVPPTTSDMCKTQGTGTDQAQDTCA
jgi:hypothetical protein